jgi:hypothetical protein
LQDTAGLVSGVIIPAEKLRVFGAEIRIQASSMRGEAAVREPIRQTMEDSQRIGAEFLIADVKVALTFLNVAENTQSEDTRRRNREHAHYGYHTVLRLLPRLSPSAAEWETLQAGLATLKGRLMALGLLDPETARSSES